MCSVAQVNSNTNDICVFHRLPDFNVFVGKDLDLLAIIPESRVKAVQQDGRLGPVDILETHVVSFVAQANENFFKVCWIVRLQLQLPIVDSMQRQWLSHDCWDSAIVGGLTDAVTADGQWALHFLMAYEAGACVGGDHTALILDIFWYWKVIVLVVKVSSDSAMLVLYVILKARIL